MTHGIITPPPAGSLRHKFDIVRRVKALGTQGQPSKETEVVGCVRVRMRTTSGNEMEQSNKRFATATHILECRHNPVLKVTDRLEGCKGCFEILHVDDVEGRGVRDIIIVRELKG